MNIPLSKIIYGILIAGAIYLAFDFFFHDTSQDDLITRFNNFVFRSTDESASGSAIKPAPDETDAWSQ